MDPQMDLKWTPKWTLKLTVFGDRWPLKKKTQISTDFETDLDLFLDVINEPKKVKISIWFRRNAFCD